MKEVKKSGDYAVHKSLFTINKNVTLSSKKIGNRIPVQATAKSRRSYNIRGKGPAKAGRPSEKRGVVKHMTVREDDEIVAFSIPSQRNKNPHNLASSVAENRAAERKN